MTEAHAELTSVGLALIESKRCSISLLREALFTLHQKELSTEAEPEALLSLVQVNRSDINGTLSRCRALVAKGLQHGISPIPYSSTLYPSTLRMISDAPPILYVRGIIDALKLAPGISVVGTRKASPHGILIAERIAKFIGDSGLTVISGLAMGIDAAAHEGALKSPVPTITVLAHGLEKASPKMNSHLAERIIEHGGAWVSEHPFGVSARPEYFVHRNRIQVGLSCASVIIEGEEKSGSATQAEFCIRARRPLFAVLPESNIPVSTHHKLPALLVQNRGALPIRTKFDYPTLLEKAVQKRAELLAGGTDISEWF